MAFSARQFDCYFGITVALRGVVWRAEDKSTITVAGGCSFIGSLLIVGDLAAQTLRVQENMVRRADTFISGVCCACEGPVR